MEDVREQTQDPYAADVDDYRRKKRRKKRSREKSGRRKNDSRFYTGDDGGRRLEKHRKHRKKRKRKKSRSRKAYAELTDRELMPSRRRRDANDFSEGLRPERPAESSETEVNVGDTVTLTNLTGGDGKYNNTVAVVFDKTPRYGSMPIARFLAMIRLPQYTEAMQDIVTAGDLYGIGKTLTSGLIKEYGLTPEHAQLFSDAVTQAESVEMYNVMWPRTGYLIEGTDGPLEVDRRQMTRIKPRDGIVPLMQWRNPNLDRFPKTDGCGPKRRLLANGKCQRIPDNEVILALCGDDEPWDPGETLRGLLEPDVIADMQEQCKQAVLTEANPKKRSNVDKMLYDMVASYYIFNPTQLPRDVMQKVARMAGYAIDRVDKNGYMRWMASGARSGVGAAAERAKSMMVPYTERAGNWLRDRAMAGAQALDDYTGGKSSSLYEKTKYGAGQIYGAAKYGAQTAYGATAAVAGAGFKAAKFIAKGGSVLANWVRTSPAMVNFSWAMVEMLKHAYCTGLSKLVFGDGKNGVTSIDERSTVWNTFLAYNQEQVENAISGGLTVAATSAAALVGGPVTTVAMAAPAVGKLAASMLSNYGKASLGKRFWIDLFQSCDELKAKSGDLNARGVLKYMRMGTKAAFAAEGDSKMVGALELATEAYDRMIPEEEE